MSIFDEKQPTQTKTLLDSDITPEHRAWMNARIEETLEKKRKGELTFRALDEVRRDYGF
tara:strand:+ start:409 stop:585 length:177 start_codon:yes stop_codon:yes gene_type:complete